VAGAMVMLSSWLVEWMSIRTILDVAKAAIVGALISTWMANFRTLRR
jgi:hypothetical protein